MMYYVEAVARHGFSIDDEIEASSLEELAQFVRETIAFHRDGIHDTSEIDCSYIDFEYNHVEDENGNDVTAEANDAR